MKLVPVTDPSFREYGQVVTGYDFKDLLKTLKEKTPRPLDSVIYKPSEPLLEALPVFEQLKNAYYGGMPIQIGYCSGHGTLLNAVEYHRDAEVNVSVGDAILFLAKQSDIDPKTWSLDTKKVKAFLLPAGKAVEIYATTLHYAPSSADETGFQVIIVLPKGTNLDKPNIKAKNGEDKLMTAANKWLIAHPDARDLVKAGAHKGLKGKNPDAKVFWAKPAPKKASASKKPAAKKAPAKRGRPAAKK